jgi:4-amino-4-deoxy-L-arabinose transferase-like glycosyltransferase
VVWVVYQAGCDLGGPRAGLAAGLLAALNPLLVWYSQEARSYAFLALWGAVSFYLTIQKPANDSALRRQRWGWAIVAVLALCTHYFAIFFLIPEAAWLVARARRPPWLQLGLVSAAGLALLPLAIEQRSSGHTDWISGTSLRTRSALIPKQFVTGLSAPHQTALAVLCLAAAAIALVGLARPSQRAPREALLAGAILVGAPILMVGLALAGVDLVLTRNAIGILPIGILAVAVGIEQLRVHVSPWAAAAPLAALLLAGATAIAGVDSDAAYQRPDWRAVGQAITATTAAQAVILEPPAAALPLGVYVPLRRIGSPRAIGVRQVDLVQFLLNVQGGRTRRGEIRPPRGFRQRKREQWPGLRLTEYASAHAHRLPMDARGAQTYLVFGR